MAMGQLIGKLVSLARSLRRTWKACVISTTVCCSHTLTLLKKQEPSMKKALLKECDMTSALKLFMKEYQMTGSEKADGYSVDALVGLSGKEKEIAFELLLKELPWSAKWLFVLDGQKAASVTREIEEEMRNKDGEDVYILQQQLVKYTGDLVYQQHMIEDYAKYRDKVRPLVIDAIDQTPTNQAKIDFFKHVLLIEVNSSAVTRAARHLLDTINFPRITDSDKAN
jgi:hypothetical protein